jgi:hypothetical protein
MGQLIYVNIKCEVGQIFDSKYKAAVFAAMKKKIGEVMAKNSSIFTLDKTKGNAGIEYELKVTLKVTRDEKSKPPRINANVEVQGMASSSGTPKTIKASGGARFEGPDPNKLERDAAQVSADAVEAVMTDKVVPAMKP